MKVKKLLAGLLVTAMVLGSSVSGFAAGSAGPTPGPVPPTPPTPVTPAPVRPVRPVRPVAPTTRTTTTTTTTTTPAKPVYTTDSKIAETAEYKVLTETHPEIVTLIDGVNAGQMDLSAIIASLTDSAADTELAKKLAGKDFVTPFFAIIWPEGTTEEQKNSIKNAEGKYVVDLNIPALTETLTGVQVLLYNAEAGEWQVEDTTALDLAKKTLSVGLKSFGMIAVIADKDSITAPAA